MFNMLTVGFFILGAIGVLASVPAMVRSFASSSWPSVTGRVLESSLDISDSRQSVPGSMGTVLPHLLYEYTVNDKPYKCSKISELRGWTESEAKKYPAMYPVGTDVTVYFNPSMHQQAVIEPGFHPSGFLGLYVSAIFMFMGAYWMFS